MPVFQVSIIGLGVTGQSLGLALKQASKEIRVVGHDRNTAAAATARKAGAVDRTDWNLPNTVREASIVILALPLGAIRDTLAVINSELLPGCLVTDTASVKAPVMAWARELLPNTVAFVGGDPIGVRGRDVEPSAALFNGTTYCLCSDPATPSQAVERAADLAQAVGAKPRFLDAVEHDGLVALLDQLPLIVSAAVLRTASVGPGWRDLAQMGGARFSLLMQLLGNDPTAQIAATKANVSNVDRWIAELQVALEDLRPLLKGEQPEAMEKTLKELAEARLAWERHDTEAPREKTDYASFGVRGLFGMQRPPRTKEPDVKR